MIETSGVIEKEQGNGFYLVTLEQPEGHQCLCAAEKIYDGLVNKKTFEIHFPKSLTIVLKILSFLPNKIYFSLVGKLTKYQKKD